MGSEFYRNEHPNAPGAGSGSGGGTGYWGVGGSGGGSSTTSGSRPYWNTPDVPGDAEQDQGYWSELNAPLLRQCPDGFLLTDGARPELLTGTSACQWSPGILCWTSGDKEFQHTDCLLISSDAKNAFSWDINPDISEKLRSSGLCAWGYLSWMRPGIITFSAKWQAGHYDHSRISQARFAVFGVDCGWRVLALKKYTRVFTIQITENYEIYVNNIRGSLDGNKKFLE